MNESLNEISKAIETLNNRDFWDYATIIAPLLLSIIAVVISIYTVRKQTKMDLFEKRQYVIYVLAFLVEGTKTAIKNKALAKELWKSGMNCFESMNSLPKSTYDDNEAFNFYSNLSFQTLKIKYLFPEKTNGNVDAFSKVFLVYITNIFSNKDTKNNEKQLEEIIDLMESEKTIVKLEKYLKIW